MLNMIAGFLPPTGGEIRVDGAPGDGPGPDRGVVFQSFALFPWRTVLDNVAFGPKMRGVAKAEREKIAREYLALAGLSHAAERYPNELSGGMQQRVGVVRALANEPDVLLMDEPFASVDAQTRMTLQEELTRIWQERRPTVLFITHDVAEAVFLANRVVVLSKGRVLDEIAVDLPRPRAWDALIEDAALQGADRARAAAGARRPERCGATRSNRARPHRAARRCGLAYLAWQVWLTLAAPGKTRRPFQAAAEQRQHPGDAAVPARALPRPRIPAYGECPGHKTTRSKCGASKRSELAALARPYWVKRVEPLPPGG